MPIVQSPTHADRAEAEATDRDAGASAVDEKGSLLPVLRVIPPEAYENPAWKGLFYFGRDLVIYGAVVTALILFGNPLIVIPLWVISAVVISSLFIVGHDSAHEALFAHKRLNSIVGHLAMLPSLHVYEGWILGHNRVHHRYTVREGFDFVWHPYKPEEYAAMSRPAKLRHRFEWSWLGAGAYYTREVWWNKMIVGTAPKRWAKAIRRDRIFVGTFASVATLLLGILGWRQGGVIGSIWMVARVLVIPFIAFQTVIGSLVHVHHISPEIRWWKRREWTKFRGQMEGTTIQKAPAGFNFFFHWIMIHIPHHVDVRIPMYNLEMAADAIREAFPETVKEEPLRFRDYLRNTRSCKLYDFDEGRWLTYAAAAARNSEIKASQPIPA